MVRLGILFILRYALIHHRQEQRPPRIKIPPRPCRQPTRAFTPISSPKAKQSNFFLFGVAPGEAGPSHLRLKMWSQPRFLPLSMPHLKVITTAIGVHLNASMGYSLPEEY